MANVASTAMARIVGTTFAFATKCADTSYISSLRNSDCADFFDEGQGCYPALVQDSEDPIEAGYFCYSTPSTDVVHLVELIQEISIRLYQKRLRLGARSRQLKSEDKNYRTKNEWKIAENQPVHIDIDREDAQMLLSIMGRFMGVQDRMHTLGFYGFKFIPVDNLCNNRSGSVDLRHACTAKHKLIISNMD